MPFRRRRRRRRFRRRKLVRRSEPDGEVFYHDIITGLSTVPISSFDDGQLLNGTIQGSTENRRAGLNIKMLKMHLQIKVNRSTNATQNQVDYLAWAVVFDRACNGQLANHDEIWLNTTSSDNVANTMPQINRSNAHRFKIVSRGQFALDLAHQSKTVNKTIRLNLMTRYGGPQGTIVDITTGSLLHFLWTSTVVGTVAPGYVSVIRTTFVR